MGSRTSSVIYNSFLVQTQFYYASRAKHQARAGLIVIATTLLRAGPPAGVRKSIRGTQNGRKNV